MAQSNIQVFSGNRITIEVDGQPVGMAQSATCSDSYALEPASQIGDIHVVEYVPTMARHQIDLELMLFYKKALADIIGDGYVLDNGLAALRGIVFDIVIRGKLIEGLPTPAGRTDQELQRIIRKYLSCSYDGGQVTVRKHAIVIQNARFMALDVTSFESAPDFASSTLR